MKNVVLFLGFVALAACNRADPYTFVEVPPGQEDPRGKGRPPLTHWTPNAPDSGDSQPGDAGDMAQPSDIAGDMTTGADGGTVVADAGGNNDAGSGANDGGSNTDGSSTDGGTGCSPQECQGVCYQNTCVPNGPTCPDFVASACTYTQGFYRTHACWSLTYLTLGATVYNQAELLTILAKMPTGNGLVALAHQLIAAKLNLANNAADSATELTVMLSDLVIGSLIVPPVGDGWLGPLSVEDLVVALDTYNQGLATAPHCE